MPHIGDGKETENILRFSDVLDELHPQSFKGTIPH
jgi:hypothetical protein